MARNIATKLRNIVITSCPSIVHEDEQRAEETDRRLKPLGEQQGMDVWNPAQVVCYRSHGSQAPCLLGIARGSTNKLFPDIRFAIFLASVMAADTSW